MLKIISTILTNADQPSISAIEIVAKCYVPLPTQFASLSNADAISRAVDPGYAVEDGNFVFTIHGAYALSIFNTDQLIKDDLISKYNAGVVKLSQFPLIPQLELAGTQWDGTTWSVIPNPI